MLEVLRHTDYIKFAKAPWGLRPSTPARITNFGHPLRLKNTPRAPSSTIMGLHDQTCCSLSSGYRFTETGS